MTTFRNLLLGANIFFTLWFLYQLSESVSLFNVTGILLNGLAVAIFFLNRTEEKE